MKKTLLMTAALALLMAGGAAAADLKFQPGEDAKFNWQSFEDFKKGHDLKGCDARVADAVREWPGGL